MNKTLRQELIKIAKERILTVDSSHDYNHAMQVLANVEMIAKEEKGDLDVLVPAALFHDIIVHPKNKKNSHKSQEDSAKLAEVILKGIKNYPQKKIPEVKVCIEECSYSRGIKPSSFSSKILQDADRLESTGAVSVMRAFSSAGQMKILLYNLADPFCKKREPSSFSFGLDLFYSRLLKVGDNINTKAAKKIAKRRTKFLRAFLKELEIEFKGK